jgi:hypothetical protein
LSIEANLQELQNKTIPGYKVSLTIDRTPPDSAWVDTLAILALMNRQNKEFLCIDESSWMLTFHERYKCKSSDRINKTVFITSDKSRFGKKTYKLPNSFILSKDNE